MCSLAQEVTLSAKLDSNRIVIGDHLKLHISAKAPIDKILTFPPTEKWQLLNCEIVESMPLEKKIADHITTYTQTLTLTSFDTGIATIAPIPLLENDSLIVATTELLQFTVDSLPIFVDTTLAFKDIKSPLDGKDITLEKQKSDGKWWKILLLCIAIAIIIAVGSYYLHKYWKNIWHKKKEIEKKQQLKTNACSWALKNLRELKQKKLWQKGEVKTYYSELSMILRTYIEHQWDINAKEMVTPDIMEQITDLDINGEEVEELKRILETADLVKFAKWSPEMDEHERSIKSASNFVQNTDREEKAKMVNPK